MSSIGAQAASTLAADGYILVSFWKPLFPVVILAGWAWIISTFYDKHCERFMKSPALRQRWNLLHLALGLIAVAAFFAVPLYNEGAFWAGLGAMVIVLFADLAIYAYAANKDDRVPKEFHIGVGLFRAMAQRREQKKATSKLGAVKLAIRGPDKQLVPPPEAESPLMAVRTAAEDLIFKALAARATEATLAPAGKDNAYAVGLLVDGLRQQGDLMPAPQAVAVIDFLKSCAKLDVGDRRRKLAGDVVIEQGTIRTKLNIGSQGVQGGMKLTLRPNLDQQVKRKRDDLGLLPEQAEELKALTSENKGLVLVAGLPDQGRTTTLNALLQLHDAYTSGIQILELETPLPLEGIRHQIFDPQADGADFATTARSLLRRDPDVLGIAEMPDANTAKEIAKSDLERSRVYLHLRADGALTALEQYVRAVAEPAAAAKGLVGLVGHKICRRLCPNCKVGYAPTPDMLKKMGVPAGQKVEQLFKKGGQVLIKNKPEVCPQCAGVGYFQTEGLFEVYRLGPEERDLIAQGNLPGVKAALRKRGLPSLQAAALRKALAGVTSIEEAMRVTTAPAAAAGAGAPAAATASSTAPAPESKA